ncbi:hypothetical protein KTH44_15990 [Acinetobacter bereziniae]|uniref:hypothetical protein n=1 Tax=Acinetobacter bereziniae TaxID=106648 RepID=UPI0021CD3AC4|nr:hypothetical protein [Acinetobacter bereziniae]MCU4320618.1 hypothetical protein [Acinetobacter bereziniae]
MTNVTDVLGNESGIQYQGVNDASGGNGAYPTIGLMVGEFRRGRLDKPMTITSQNIRALLGYDPENLAYVAVQDVLNTGIPSVQVLRLNTFIEESLNIVCNNESNIVRVAFASKPSEIPPIASRSISNEVDPRSYLELKIDGIEYNLINSIPAHIQIDSSNTPLVFLPDGYQWLDAFQFINLNKESTSKIEFKSNNRDLFIFAWDNSTIVKNLAGTHYGACLATNKEIVEPEPDFEGEDWFVLKNVTDQDLYIDDALVATANAWDTQYDYLKRLQRIFSSYSVDMLFIGMVNNNIPAIYLRNEKIASTKISFKKNGYVKGTITATEENINTSFVETSDGVTIQLGKQFTEELVYNLSQSNNFFVYQYYSVSDFSKAQAMMQIYIDDKLFVTSENDPLYYSKDLERWHGIRSMSKEFYEHPILENINTYVFENMTENTIKLRFRYFTPLGCQSTKTALNDSSNYLERNLCIVLAPRKLVIDVGQDRNTSAINLRYEFSRKYPVYLKSDLVIDYNIKAYLKPNIEEKYYFSDTSPVQYCNALCNIDPAYSKFEHVKAYSIFVGKFPNKLIKGDGSGYENRWGADIEYNNQWIKDSWGTNVILTLHIESEIYGLGGAGGNIVDRLTGNYDLNGQNGFSPICNFEDDVTINLRVKSTGKLIAGGGGGASFPTGKLYVEFKERHTFENSNEWTEWTDWQFDKITEEFYLLGGTGGLPNGITGNYGNAGTYFPSGISITNEYAYSDYLLSTMNNPRYAFNLNVEEMSKFNSGLQGEFAKRSVKSPPSDSIGMPFVINNVSENSGLYQREFKRKWQDLRNEKALGGLAGTLITGGKVGKILIENGGVILCDDFNELNIEYI